MWEPFTRTILMAFMRGDSPEPSEVLGFAPQVRRSFERVNRPQLIATMRAVVLFLGYLILNDTKIN